MTAATLGILVLGEHLNARAFTGIGLIFAGLLLLVIRKRTVPAEVAA
jgi:DME family drug/metabolite transporter